MSVSKAWPAKFLQTGFSSCRPGIGITVPFNMCCPPSSTLMNSLKHLNVFNWVKVPNLASILKLRSHQTFKGKRTTSRDTCKHSMMSIVQGIWSSLCNVWTVICPLQRWWDIYTQISNYRWPDYGMIIQLICMHDGMTFIGYRESCAFLRIKAIETIWRPV